MCCKEIRLAFGASDKCVQNNALQAEEDGKKFKIQPSKDSKDSFCRIHVDGCLIRDENRKKCDYWFRQCHKKLTHNYFVEFKGSDIKVGFDQIVETIAHIREKNIVLVKESIHGVIVANKVPLRTSKAQVLQEKFRKHHGMNFFIKSNEFTLVFE